MVSKNDEIKTIFNSLNFNINKITEIKTLANFLVKVGTNKGNYFLKMYNNKKEARAGHKLACLYPFLLKNNIPVPGVLKFDDSLKLVKHPYLIITEIEGEMLCEVINTMNTDDKKSFYYELGRLIAKIHSITFKKFGETFDGKTVESYSEANYKGPFSNWKDMHKEIINYRLNIFKGSNFEDLIKPISSWFEQNANLIDYKIVPRLLHIDLNQKNIFLKNNKISGIIDFDDAFVGHNEEELMRTEGANFSNNNNNNNNLRQSFFKGYTEIIKLDDNYEQRRKYYYFARLLVHTDCIIQYGDNYVNVEKEQQIVKKEMLKLLNNKQTKFDKNKRNT
ncbi:MAG: phosphotransferase [Nanoarchaeota archaeon]|nr:phosphotransferase [Nanoarchaeota archaeon]